MSWKWEYVPDEETVAAGAPPTLLAEVEKAADELVRAAEALYLHGPGYQDADEGAKHAFVIGVGPGPGPFRACRAYHEKMLRSAHIGRSGEGECDARSVQSTIRH